MKWLRILIATFLSVNLLSFAVHAELSVDQQIEQAEARLEHAKWLLLMAHVENGVRVIEGGAELLAVVPFLGITDLVAEDSKYVGRNTILSRVVRGTGYTMAAVLAVKGLINLGEGMYRLTVTDAEANKIIKKIELYQFQLMLLDSMSKN